VKIKDANRSLSEGLSSGYTAAWKSEVPHNFQHTSEEPTRGGITYIPDVGEISLPRSMLG
jgi:hypothetical protein